MKIEKIEAWYTRYPLAETWKPFWWRPDVRRSIADNTVIKITTDDGIEGWGTSFDPNPSNRKRIVEELWPRIDGKSPFMYEELTNIMNSARIEGINPWAVDLALWDIVGKAAGQPVWALMGANAPQAIPYASCTTNLSNEARAESVKALIDEGWVQCKIHLGPDKPILESLKYIQAAREAAGDKIRIAVDTHQNVESAMGRKGPPRWGREGAFFFGRQLDQMGQILWMEDCLPRQDYTGMRQLCEALVTPVSCGGISASLVEIEKLVSTPCLDQIQPGPGMNESVWTLRKMITLCETHYTAYSPHTWSSLDAVAGLHIGAATPAVSSIEAHYDPPNQPMVLANCLLKEPLNFNKKDGTWDVPMKPGWGVEIDIEQVKKYEAFE
jgi:L-alanine-DL-glutamate epimerase-like enolase superfamily enzyme